MFNKKRRIPIYNPTYRQAGLPAVNLARSRSLKFPNRRPSPSLTRFKKIAFLLMLAGGLGFFIYTMIFSNFFNIKNIVIGNKSFENESISNQIKDTLKSSMGKNIFLLKVEGLESKLLNIFPELERITIDKDYPGTLSIEFSERPLIANVINESNVIKKSYILNSVGFAIKEDMEDPNLPYIKIKTDEPINPKKAVIEKAKLNYILEAKTYFEDKFGMRIREIQYKPVPRELHLLTERDFYIWLDIQKSYEDQFKKLKKAIVKLDIYKENLEYIDLRIAGNSGDKIIYKRRK